MAVERRGIKDGVQGRMVGRGSSQARPVCMCACVGVGSRAGLLKGQGGVEVMAG